jgi:hypothetical protein
MHGRERGRVWSRNFLQRSSMRRIIEAERSRKEKTPIKWLNPIGLLLIIDGSLPYKEREFDFNTHGVDV